MLTLWNLFLQSKMTVHLTRALLNLWKRALEDNHAQNKTLLIDKTPIKATEKMVNWQLNNFKYIRLCSTSLNSRRFSRPWFGVWLPLKETRKFPPHHRLVYKSCLRLCRAWYMLIFAGPHQIAVLVDSRKVWVQNVQEHGSHTSTKKIGHAEV